MISRHAIFPPLCLALVLGLAASCKHVQPLDTKPLDVSGMDYGTIKQLQSFNVTAPEVAELSTARGAGFSDASCVAAFQISHSRGEAFNSGEAIAGLVHAGMREQTIIELDRLNQLGLGAGELEAMHLAGLSDAIVLQVAHHRAEGKPEFSGASLAGMKNAGLRESTILELATRGIPDSQAAAIIASRRHGAKDAEILRRFAGS
ncbi:MAG: hypothetical protein WB780_20070 [Candidatus Acidiferrales bacterium]